MPILTRWFVKTALVYLVAALVLGIAQPHVPTAGPVYVHLLVVGWITQVIFGVAYWMFPRDTRDAPRGDDWLAIASYVCLNAGLVLRVVAEPVYPLHPTPGWGRALVLSAVLQWLGGMAFVVNTWGRVKAR
jgi:Trk-type K+ transport system membrane component